MSAYTSNPTTVSTPESPVDAANTIINGMAGGNVVLVMCACDVEYVGRAGGYLPRGNRTILIKPDGNFLVIGSTKHKARNWQPTGAETSVDVSDDVLTLESTRTGAETEQLVAYCDEVYQVITYAAGDDPDVTLTGTEFDMHQRIIDEPTLIESGFVVHEHEYPVDSGRNIDIFGEDSSGTPVVVEVKRRHTQRKDVDQLHEYTKVFDESVRGILVAPSASENVLNALADRGLEFVSLEPELDCADID
jgi:hypothetical protein